MSLLLLLLQAALPEGDDGLAARYPGDAGLEKDPAVVFVETFEGTVDEICARWDQAAGKPIMSKSDERPPGSPGGQSLLLTRTAGGTDGYMDGGNFYRRLKGHDRLFLRFYMKFNRDHAPIHHYGAGLLGINPPSRWPLGRAGLRPKGDHLFTTQIEPGNLDSWYFYTYWQDMRGSPPRGQTWGNTFQSGQPLRPVAREAWICLELMVKMNDVGDSNGEQAYWIDGRLAGHVGKGVPAVGTWKYDRFEPGSTARGIEWDDAKGKGVPIEGGTPFPGFRWRNVPELNINAVWLYRYMSKPETGTSQVWWDHLVAATSYIGPIRSSK